MATADWSGLRADVDALNRLGRKAKYDARNRTALLAIHVVFGLAMGITFLVVDVPLPWKVGLGMTPGHDAAWSLLVALVPITGALLLGAGLVARRNLPLEGAGMIVLICWELVGVRAVRHWFVMTHPGPVQYQIWFYLLPAALLLVHLSTLGLYVAGERRHP